MRKKIQITAAAVSVMIQVLTMLIYSFSEFQISVYVYLAVWSVCGIVIYHLTSPTIY